MPELNPLVKLKKPQTQQDLYASYLKTLAPVKPKTPASDDSQLTLDLLTGQDGNQETTTPQAEISTATIPENQRKAIVQR